MKYSNLSFIHSVHILTETCILSHSFEQVHVDKALILPACGFYCKEGIITIRVRPFT